MDFFLSCFISDIKCGNCFSTLEMLSDIINWGGAETEKKKVLNFFLLRKSLATVLCAVGYGRSKSMNAKVDMVLCSCNYGFKLKLHYFKLVFKF